MVGQRGRGGNYRYLMKLRIAQSKLSCTINNIDLRGGAIIEGKNFDFPTRDFIV